MVFKGPMEVGCPMTHKSDSNSSSEEFCGNYTGFSVTTFRGNLYCKYLGLFFFFFFFFLIFLLLLLFLLFDNFLWLRVFCFFFLTTFFGSFYCKHLGIDWILFFSLLPSICGFFWGGGGRGEGMYNCKQGFINTLQDPNCCLLGLGQVIFIDRQVKGTHTCLSDRLSSNIDRWAVVPLSNWHQTRQL